MSLYQKFIFIREEIMKHKWIESEKQNHDIGFESALVDWVTKHRPDWLEAQKKIDNGAE
jgi:hypothetical protein